MISPSTCYTLHPPHRPERWIRITLDGPSAGVEIALDTQQSLFLACSRAEAEQRLANSRAQDYTIQEERAAVTPTLPPPVPQTAPAPNLDQAYQDWAGGLAYITNSQYRLRQQVINGVTVVNHIAPWNALVKAAYPNSLDFHLYATAKHPKPKKVGVR